METQKSLPVKVKLTRGQRREILRNTEKQHSELIKKIAESARVKGVLNTDSAEQTPELEALIEKTKNLYSRVLYYESLLASWKKPVKTKLSDILNKYGE